MPNRKTNGRKDQNKARYQSSSGSIGLSKSLCFSNNHSVNHGVETTTNSTITFKKQKIQNIKINEAKPLLTNLPALWNIKTSVKFTYNQNKNWTKMRNKSECKSRNLRNTFWGQNWFKLTNQSPVIFQSTSVWTSRPYFLNTIIKEKRGIWSWKAWKKDLGIS